MLRSRLLLFVVAITSTIPARGAVVHGFKEIQPNYLSSLPGLVSTDAFDFSAQAIVDHLSTNADLSYQEMQNHPGDWDFFDFSGIVTVPNTTLEQIQQAPVDGYVFDNDARIGRSYVAKTTDGLYAKFRITEFNDGLGGDDKGCCSIVIEYYVQMDGTPTFGPALPVDQTTWGRVKALYR